MLSCASRSCDDDHETSVNGANASASQNGPLVILSRGRSGSTYVQRVLNCCRNLYIFGEHDGVIASLARALEGFEQHGAAENADKILTKTGVEDSFLAWGTPFSHSEIVGMMGETLTRAFTARLPGFDANTIWGFKEIRYDGDDVRRLHELFPGLRVLIIYRDFESYAHSVHRAHWRDTAVEVTHYKNILDGYVQFYESVLAVCDELQIPFQVVSYDAMKDDWRMIVKAVETLVQPAGVDVDSDRAEEAARLNVDFYDKSRAAPVDPVRFGELMAGALAGENRRRLEALAKTIRRREFSAQGHKLAEAWGWLTTAKDKLLHRG